MKRDHRSIPSLPAVVFCLGLLIGNAVLGLELAEFDLEVPIGTQVALLEAEDGLTLQQTQTETQKTRIRLPRFLEAFTLILTLTRNGERYYLKTALTQQTYGTTLTFNVQNFRRGSPALLNLWIPVPAQVEVNHWKIKWNKTPLRHFKTPEIQPDRDYYYAVCAELPGAVAGYCQVVFVRAGEESNLVFTRESFTRPQSSTIKFVIPKNATIVVNGRNLKRKGNQVYHHTKEAIGKRQTIHVEVRNTIGTKSYRFQEHIELTAGQFREIRVPYSSFSLINGGAATERESLR